MTIGDFSHHAPAERQLNAPAERQLDAPAERQLDTSAAGQLDTPAWQHDAVPAGLKGTR